MIKQYANYHGYSDVHPVEVVRIISDSTVEVRAMDAVLDPEWKPEIIPGGFVGHCVNQGDQKHIITSNEENPVFRVRLSRSKNPRKNGYWFDSNGSRYVMNDKPVRFYDYNF